MTPASKTAFDYGVHTRAQKNEQLNSPTKKLPAMDMSDDEDDEATEATPPDSTATSPVKPTPALSTSTSTKSSSKTVQHMSSNETLKGRGSDAWEVLTSGDSSLIADDIGNDTSSTGPLPWKSAINGKSLEELECEFPFHCTQQLFGYVC